MNIKLSYQPQNLAPPQAYASVMLIEIAKGYVNLEFNLEYLGRDGISDDELRAEGFTRNDGFSWSGEVSTDWIADIESIKGFNFTSEPHPETYMHIEIDNVAVGFPSEIEFTELLFQELMQSILEKEEIEAPLFIEYTLSERTIKLEWKFSERLILLNDKPSMSWENGREVLRLIYSLDFAVLVSTKKANINTLNPGDGLWYHISDKAHLNQVKQLLGNF